MSKKGWEIAERAIPKAGLLGREAAIAPPTNACAVAVILVSLVYQDLSSCAKVPLHGTLWVMFPTLFTVGQFSISSFGLLLTLGFLSGIFLVWRLSRAWDLDEEKILDLTLLTFIGGIVLSRLYFVIEHWSFFILSPLKIFYFTRAPGFSLWGAFLGGWLTLYFFARKFKINFWQAADIAAVGFLGGLILKDAGCLLGSCDIGINSRFFLAVQMAGIVGKRIPVAGIEALLLSLILGRIWSQATHFHQSGKIAGMFLIYWGAVRLLLEGLRVRREYFLDMILLSLGITIYYKVSGRNFTLDVSNSLKFIFSLFTKTETRKRALQIIKKTWYNQTTALKKWARRLNVRFSYKNTGGY